MMIVTIFRLLLTFQKVRTLQKMIKILCELCRELNSLKKMKLHLVLHNAFGNTVRFFWPTTVRFSTEVSGCKLGWLLSNREGFLICANFLTFKRTKINQQH